jgi:hygromycin-B 7''-O-kinase
MPRLPGRHFNDQELKENINKQDNKQIVELLAKCLSELHLWRVASYGEFDPKNHRICPFDKSYKIWLFDRIRYWLGDAKKYSVITKRDVEWVESLLLNSEEAFDVLQSPTFVMGDFKADNVLYQENGEEILARHFISEYFNLTENKEAFKERFKVHMLHQRVLDWGCAKAIGKVTWDNNLSFSAWAERYTEIVKY